MIEASLYIDGQWPAGAGASFASIDPATGEPVWQGAAASAAQIDAAVGSARRALDAWSNASLDARIAILNPFAAEVRAHRAELAELISREVGKPDWEALTEVDAMAGKVPLSIAAYRERRHPSETESAGAIAATRYKPFGVVAVFGPFNFPGHLPNGHIVPALLAGNTVVFKPSELTPAVAQKTIELWHAAGLPAGAINLLQGGKEVGAGLARHAGVDGIYFTGSVAVGRALANAAGDQPGKILALETGGNNPLIVHEASDLSAAAYHTIQSAYITSGQRCSCARRLIVPRGPAGDAFINRLVAMVRKLVVGAHTDRPEPFMGPVVSDAAANQALAAQRSLLDSGGVPMLEMRPLNDRPALLSPGLIDVTAITDRPDAEIFAPLLQLIRVADFDAAIDAANRTAFGLAAGLLSDRRELYEAFFRRARAGLINWNRPTTGASSALPFGGIGLSGNHRPSGYFAADYCSYPVASLEAPTLRLPERLPPGMSI